jgi:hypothetical protein
MPREGIDNQLKEGYLSIVTTKIAVPPYPNRVVANGAIKYLDKPSEQQKAADNEYKSDHAGNLCRG